MDPGTRVCTHCEKAKPLQRFSETPNGPHRRSAVCDMCRAARIRAIRLRPRATPAWVTAD